MPIYAYKCESCGFAKDVLQKISDAPLQDCPQCSQPSFKKQVTAAGFQLKGSGWYVTDFRGGNAAPTGVAPASGGEAVTATSAAPAAAPAKTETAPAAAPAASTPSTPTSST